MVAVFDLAEDGDETWLVMEYVEGITLSAFVRRDGALTPDEAAPWVRQAADALAAAHAAGIIHRDVKPSNMLLTRGGDVKITDFGIARAEADASLTQTGLVTGSPAYLAPEIASGATATEASDVWSLGATLYHLLAGQPPYDVNENLMGALYKIVHEDPPRLANAGWLAPALEHTMAREPDDRWRMTQVRDFLGQGPGATITPAFVPVGDPEGTRVLQATPAEPIAVPPVIADPAITGPVAPVPTSGQDRRSPWPWILAAAVVLALAVIAGAALIGTRGGGETPSAGGSSGHSSPSSPSSSKRERPGGCDAVVHHDLPVDRDQRPARLVGDADDRVPEGERWLREVPAVLARVQLRDPDEHHAEPRGSQRGVRRRLRAHRRQHQPDQVTLHLVRDGASYLINGES